MAILGNNIDGKMCSAPTNVHQWSSLSRLFGAGTVEFCQCITQGAVTSEVWRHAVCGRRPLARFVWGHN